jgi:hypothetical protein
LLAFGFLLTACFLTAFVLDNASTSHLPFSRQNFGVTHPAHSANFGAICSGDGCGRGRRNVRMVYIFSDKLPFYAFLCFTIGKYAHIVFI